MTIKIKKLSETATPPKYANPGDAGMDFYSDETVNLQPNERKLISTGISMAIPEGYVGLIWDKTGSPVFGVIFFTLTSMILCSFMDYELIIEFIFFIGDELNCECGQKQIQS